MTIRSNNKLGFFFGIAVVCVKGPRHMMTSTEETQKHEYIALMKAQLDEWSKRINFIKSQVDNKSLNVKNEYHGNMAEWKAKREVLLGLLDQILNHNGNGFETLRYSAQKARFDVLVAYKKFSDIN